jgi:hypothetical protein
MADMNKLGYVIGMRLPEEIPVTSPEFKIVEVVSELLGSDFRNSVTVSLARAMRNVARRHGLKATVAKTPKTPMCYTAVVRTDTEGVRAPVTLSVENGVPEITEIDQSVSDRSWIAPFFDEVRKEFVRCHYMTAYGPTVKQKFYILVRRHMGFTIGGSYFVPASLRGTELYQRITDAFSGGGLSGMLYGFTVYDEKLSREFVAVKLLEYLVSVRDEVERRLKRKLRESTKDKIAKELGELISMVRLYESILEDAAGILADAKQSLVSLMNMI